jgi:tubulin polyglutamylase TTLL6/13
MLNLLPKEYTFFPHTYMLPHDYKDFHEVASGKNPRTFIVKPDDSCQGKGIWLTRDPKAIKPTD